VRNSVRLRCGNCNRLPCVVASCLGQQTLRQVAVGRCRQEENLGANVASFGGSDQSRRHFPLAGGEVAIVIVGKSKLSFCAIAPPRDVQFFARRITSVRSSRPLDWSISPSRSPLVARVNKRSSGWSFKKASGEFSHSALNRRGRKRSGCQGRRSCA
jgi:hypothetical protein